MSECLYLGHVIGSGRIYPENEKVKAIHDYSSIATPLTDLTQKTKPNKVMQSRECDNAFKQIFDNNFKKEFILQIDASDRGVSAILSQLDDHQNDYPIANFSRETAGQGNLLLYNRGVSGDQTWDPGLQQLSHWQKVQG